VKVLRAWLAHPITRGLDVDDPATTALRARIIREKPFLREVYREWYEALAAAVPPGPRPALELGCGAGFLHELVPGLIRSDIMPLPGTALALDARALPFGVGTLRAIVMTDVFHHIPDVGRFLREAGRVVARGGAVVMIEPWVTGWSRLVYGRLHHEPFEPRAARWEFAASGPLSDSNIALPWIVFCRDRARFEAEFPEWRIERVAPQMPFRYLLSGGVSMRSLMPGAAFPFWRWVDRQLDRHAAWSMFALVVLRRVEGGSA
jgi:SAM-dependent methyltransferase